MMLKRIDQVQTFIDTQMKPHGVFDERVHNAFTSTDRCTFFPQHDSSVIYADQPLSLIKYGASGRFDASAISWGLLINRILKQQHSLGKSMVVGSATGYSAALVSYFSTHVIALESNQSLHAIAAKALSDLTSVQPLQGDLASGYDGNKPYDTIILGGAVDHAPDALIAQLKEGGCLYAVIGSGRAARLTAYHKINNNISITNLDEIAMPHLPDLEALQGFQF